MQEFSLKYNRPLMFAIQSVTSESSAVILSTWHDMVMVLIEEFKEKYVKGGNVHGRPYVQASLMYPETNIKCVIRLFGTNYENGKPKDYLADIKMPNTTKRISSKKIKDLIQEEQLLGHDSDKIRVQQANKSGKKVLSQLGYGEENEEKS